MYDAGFYDVIRAGCQQSAHVVAPLVLASIHRSCPRVIDVGCGEGWWAHAFAELGCDVIGVDGAYVTSSQLGDRFIGHDLRHSLPDHLAGRFDLAISLEVAEHLPPDRAESFIADLCALAPIVLFSAAIPGQGGTGHVNEQWPSYWAALFAGQGYSVSGALRWLIWDDDRIENWYRQNLLVAVNEPEAHPDLFRDPTSAPIPIVHPVLYDARRRR